MNRLITKILRLRKVIAGRDFYSWNQINIERKTLGGKDASWTISDLGLKKESIIYSFGVGTDISFDLQLIRDYHCKIQAFDPTPKSISWLESQKIPDKFNFHPYGIAAINGKIDLFLPENDNYVSGSILPELILTSSKISVDVFDLISIMNMLGNRYIDILKMDIEGAEYDVIQNIINNRIDIKQILIEFHHRFPGIGVSRTKEAIKDLNAAGYRIFSVSASGEEFSFIKY